MIYNHITELIGNTPLLKIDPSVHGLKNIDLYAKLELFNPFGSLKDRVAWEMIREDLSDIQKKDMTILESSSGNTAKALQVLASVHGVKFKTITNRIKVSEARDVLSVLGATIDELPGKSDCYDPSDPNDPVVFINREIKNNAGKRFFTSQYSNPKNLSKHYQTTGQEIVDDLGNIDYFFGGLGTTGSTRGTAMKLAEVNPNIKTIGIVAEKSDYIPGIRNRDEILEVGLFEPDFYEKLEYVTSTDAVDAMLTLVRKAGVLAGPTSGASYIGAVTYLQEIDSTLNERQTAVFIVCDRMEWYVSYIKERRPELFGGKKRITWHDQLQISAILPIIPIHKTRSFIDNEQPVIIDTRSPLAYKMGHIDGSINFPYDQLDNVLNDAIPFETGKPLLFVCAVGEKSLTIAQYLQANGYHAYSLDEGITAWRDADLPLTRKILQ